MILKGRMLVAVLVTMVSLITGVGVTHAQTPGAGAAGKQAPVDRLGSAKASLKARFGFTEAQATTTIQKAQAIAMTYQPQLVALQKKYGTSPTPEQRQKFQREALPIIAEISKKTNAIILSVATKEQRPKVLAQIKTEQEQIAKMLKAKSK